MIARYDIDVPRRMHDAFLRGDKFAIHWPVTPQPALKMRLFTWEPVEGTKAQEPRSLNFPREGVVRTAMKALCPLQAGMVVTPESAGIALFVDAIYTQQAHYISKAELIHAGMEDCDKRSPEAVRNRFGYIWDGHFGKGSWQPGLWVYVASLRQVDEAKTPKALRLRVRDSIRCV